MRASVLANELGLELDGEDCELIGAAALEAAGGEELSWIANARGGSLDTKAGCVIAPLDYSGAAPAIRAKDPRAAFSRALALLYPESLPAPGIHPTAYVDPTAELGEGVSIGPNVTVYRHVKIGARTIVHAGAVIGSDGFGFTIAEGRWQKFPQVGRVEIGCDCEIGANSTIDRASLGVTRIGDGTKLDNMVHVGHNVTIGKHVVIAAQTGISGGAVIEDYVVIAGQVGIADKVKIESRAVLGAQCGVPTSKIIRAGETVWGTPARPIKAYLKSLATLASLTRKKG
jgi:UDP-3-O-[3-hydroxymyristoyl] glucosamine N-acyltransferase